jgi:hypothetical protein
MTAPIEADVYIAALHIQEMFIDNTYQRVLDVPRARKYAAAWDRRLAGILEVSDRGEGQTPRYAIVDGQHRWAAAGYFVNPPPLVVNVHTGLTIAEEADLWDKLNRQRKQTGTWDHWKARRASGDEKVLAIEDVVRRNKLSIALSPSDNCIACVASLEKIVKVGGCDLLNETLSLIVECWGGRRDALDAAIIHGLALVLHYIPDLDLVRFGDALLEIVPRQLRSQAAALKEITHGTLPVLTAIALMSLYNKRAGRKIEVTHKTFGGTGIHNASRDRGGAAAPKKRRAPSATQSPALEQVGNPLQPKRTLPSGVPHYADTDEHAAAVDEMAGRPVAEIAKTLGIPERTVRRIQADLGIDVAS